MHFSERDFYDNSLKKTHEKQKNNKRTTYKKNPQFLAPWSNVEKNKTTASISLYTVIILNTRSHKHITKSLL
jgi:hypothetical protein